MKSSAEILPTDPQSLKKLVLLQQKSIDDLEKNINKLESELRLYKIHRFKSQSEKAKTLFDETGLKQLELFPDELQATLEALSIEPEEETPKTGVKPRARKSRKPRQLDPSLLRVEVVHDLEDKTCDHCEKEMQCIGEETVEQLAIVPAKQYVIKHIRKKYACGCKQCMKRAEMPRQPISKSKASAQLLAFLMVSKFLDGLPLYRLSKILYRYRLELSRQNMARWLIQASMHFDRLFCAFEQASFNYDILLADETRIQVLNEPDRDPTTKSWLWIRRGGPPDQRVILINYDPSRSAQVPEGLLGPFKDGYLVVDAYSGYKPLENTRSLVIVGCHDHARRKFVEAFESLDKKARNIETGIAKQAIERYKKLYEIEKAVKDKTPEEKKATRQQLSLPMLQAFKEWLMKVKEAGVAHEKTMVAVNYFLNQYEALVRYCEDGRLPISNILSEHVAKSIAIARKNFLFCNSQEGAHAAAKIYSMILTAAQHNLEPTKYLTYVLSEMPTIRSNEPIEHLLPWNLNKEKLDEKISKLPML